MIKSVLKRAGLCLAAVLVSIAAFAQSTVTVSGVVLDSQNQPVLGAAVMEQGTTNGAVTDMDGKFTITVKSGAMLEVSSLGYGTEVVKAANNVKVILNEETEMVDETVVVGYTTQKKSDLTGAVTVVTVSDLKNTPSVDVMSALQGRVAGMNISQTGDPSANASVRIRGIGTLNNTNPLYIVDGMPTTQGIKEINASDIESIQVLKDAASASIYGSRAANGVIIVTTNRGREGRLAVNFNSSWQYQVFNKGIELCDAFQFGEALYRAYTHDGYDPNTNPYCYKFDANGNVLNKIGEPLTNSSNGAVSPNMLFSNTDWWDEISQNALRQNYELSVSNGSKKGQYYVSFGYNTGKGNVINSFYNRYNTRVNSSFNLFDGVVTIGENLTISYSSQNGAASNASGTSVLSHAYADMPNVPVHTTDGGWGGPFGGMSDRSNVARVVNDARNNGSNNWRIMGSAYIDIKPIKNLTLKTSFSPEYSNGLSRSYIYPYKEGNLAGVELSATFTNTSRLNWTWSTTANYNLEAGRHRANFLLGHEMISNDSITLSMKTQGYDDQNPNYMWPSAATGASSTSGSETRSALQSFFAKVDYSFANKYLLGLTARYDGSSKFGKDNRFAFFPSVSAGWRISQESFLRDVKWLTDLKIRGSWGTNGNQQIQDGAAYSLFDTGTSTSPRIVWGTWNFGTSYDIAGNRTGAIASGYRRTQTGNTTLKWETSTQWDLGFDYTLWNYKLYGSFDWFFKNTYDILVKPAVLSAQGEGADRYENGASMTNAGIEFTIGTRGKTGFGMSYDINGNISTYRNKVTYLPESVLSQYPGNGTTDTVIGRHLNSYYGYVENGLYTSEAELNDGIKIGALNKGKGLGRMKWVDRNGDGEITVADRQFFGSPEPTFAFGLNINLGYKSFDLSMFWEGKVGYYAYTADKSQRTLFVTDMGSNKGADILKAWDPVTNPNSKIPALTTANNNNETGTNTYFYEDHSYGKLRNLTIGYTLPDHIAKSIKLSRVRVYVTGQNLFWFKSKDFTGWDPEMTSMSYPLAKTFLGGLQLSF